MYNINMIGMIDLDKKKIEDVDNKELIEVYEKIKNFLDFLNKEKENMESVLKDV